MALAVAMVACQAATPVDKTPVALGGATLSDMSFPDFVAGTDTAVAKTVTITGSHFKGTELKYTATSSNASVATATVTGSVVTVTPKGAGTATVTVIAAATADDEEGTQSLSFTVTVTGPAAPPANNPPTVRTISSVSLVVAETEPITLSEYFTDPEGEALTYTADSSNDAIATVTDPDANSMITITAVAAGRTTISITANDGTNAAVSQTFRVTVTDASVPDNNQPYRTAPLPDLTGLKVDVSPDPIDLSNHFEDDEDDKLDYTASPDDAGVVTVEVSGSMLTITVVAPGTTTINVNVADDANNQVRGSFNVTVVNQAPMVVAAEPTKFGPYLPGDTLTITVSEYFTDAEGDSLTYTAASDGETIATVTDPDDADSNITITAKAVGEAMITITADDGTSVTSHTLTVTVSAVPNVAPEVVGDGIPDQSLQLVVDETTMTESATKPLDVEEYFSDPDGTQPLEYSTDSDMVMVNGSTLTITASVAGTTEITVTARDGAASVQDTFTVTVSSPERPERTGPGLNLQTFSSPSADPMMIELGQYFEREVGYRASSDNPTAVEATVDGATLTLTPKAAGDAVVTVTPFNSGGDGAPLTFRVRVEPEPTTTPAPPTINSADPILDRTLVLGDDIQPMDISGHFRGEVTSYEAVSRAPATVVADVTDAGELTLTLLKHGSARVTVTARNSGGEVSDDFNVTVQAKPTTAENMMFEPVKVVAITQTDAAAVTGETNATPLIAAVQRYMLDNYITDPDGDDTELEFTTTTDDQKVVAVYDTPPANATTDGNNVDGVDVVAEGAKTVDDLNKAIESKKANVTLRGRKAGTAMITITATDEDKLVDTWTVMVTVASANTPPSVATSGTEIDAAPGTAATDGTEFPGGVTPAGTDNHRYHDFAILADTGRFLSTGGNAVKKLKVDLATLFIDPDVESNQRTTGDKWKFSAKSNNKDVVTAHLEPTNNVRKPDEHNVVITRVGSGEATITLEVTDSFDKSDTQEFDVRVNHAPMDQGGQDDPKTLEDATDPDIAQFRKLSDNVAAIANISINLTDYFSDKDTDDVLWCFGDKRGAVTDQLNVVITNTGDRALTVSADALQDDDIPSNGKRIAGVGYLDITCADRTSDDAENMETATATLTVEIVRSPDFSVNR